MRSPPTPAAYRGNVGARLQLKPVAGNISDYRVQSGASRGVKRLKGRNSSREVTGSSLPMGGTRLKLAVLLPEVFDLLL